MKIGKHEIGAGQPVFVVAELGGNHYQDIITLCELIRVAKDAGADAVKTQCFTLDGMTLDVDDDAHRLTWAGRERTLYEVYAETAMPMHWHQAARLWCSKVGMEYFASVFSPVDCDYMDALGVPCFKIASFELTDLPLIRHVAAKGRPVMVSTGMATWQEIDYDALSLVNRDLAVVLKCTSAYPALIADSNLKAMPVWGMAYGLSDHTRNNAVVCAAVAMGACVVERHLTLSRADGGPDAAFSDEPHEFAAMVQAVRDTTAALGTVRYGPTDSERPMLRFRRSLWVTREIYPGQMFTADNIACLRPEGGLPPAKLPEILGTTSLRYYKRGEALT